MLQDCHTHNLNSNNGIISIEPGFTAFESSKYYSCGLHPWNTPTDASSLIELINEMALQNNIIALGEAGLDRMKGADISVQEKIFIKEIEVSEILKLPLIIHCVRASSELIALKKRIRPTQPWIFHGFRGGFLHAKDLIDAGFYISLGERFNSESINAIPDDRLLIETDTSILNIEEIAANIKPKALEISTYNLNNIFNNTVY